MIKNIEIKAALPAIALIIEYQELQSSFTKIAKKYEKKYDNLFWKYIIDHAPAALAGLITVATVVLIAKFLNLQSDVKDNIEKGWEEIIKNHKKTIAKQAEIIKTYKAIIPIYPLQGLSEVPEIQSNQQLLTIAKSSVVPYLLKQFKDPNSSIYKAFFSSSGSSSTSNQKIIMDEGISVNHIGEGFHSFNIEFDPW